MVSVENFNAFLNLFVQQFNACYTWLSSISIAGLTMFEWILGFMAAGAIFTIIRAFAGVGGVSVTGVASGAAEQVRLGQAEGRRKAAQRESESYEHYASTRSRNAAYDARYKSEHKGGN